MRATLVLAALACAPGVPEPEFVTPFDKAAPDSIRAYLSQLEFDERDGSGDEQPLLIDCPDACRIGPRVAVHPEKRSHNNNADDLATGPGRIVARFINRDQKEGYPRLNLAPGDTVYWAVDSVRSVDKRLSRGRSLYISARGLRESRAGSVTIGPLFIDEHPDQKKVNTAVARWIFDTTSYEERETPGGHTDFMRVWSMVAWGNCKSSGCCR
jgi:hypothetical protein